MFIGMNIVLEAALLAGSATHPDFNHTANTIRNLKQAHFSFHTFCLQFSRFLLCGWPI